MQVLEKHNQGRKKQRELIKTSTLSPVIFKQSVIIWRILPVPISDYVINVQPLNGPIWILKREENVAKAE